MSTRIGAMTQAASGLTVEVYEGWSWPCFFFGAFWYLVKGMWGIAIVWIALALVSASVAWWLGILFLPAIANRQYREHLGARGYTLDTALPPALTLEQSSERTMGYAVLGGIVVVIFGLAMLAG